MLNCILIVLSFPSLIFLIVQAAEHTAAAARAVAEDNARAAPVLISGATGCYANTMNGLFAPSKERNSSGRVVYRKCCDACICIEHIDGQWQIKPDRDLGRSALQGCVVGGCALESCLNRVWCVGVGGNVRWQDQPTVKIAIGADVERQVNGALLPHHLIPFFFPDSLPNSPFYLPTFAQAADCMATATLCFAEDNARAAPVLISGASGCFAGSVNGFYVPTQEKSSDGSHVYSKCGDASTCIERVGWSWVVKTVDYKGFFSNNYTARFGKCDPFDGSSTGPRVLVGTHKLEYCGTSNVSHNDVKMETGEKVNRKVSPRHDHFLRMSHSPLPHLTRCICAQAAEYDSEVAHAVAEDNARAAPVLITGADNCGLYVPTATKGLDGRIMYLKSGDDSMCIEHFHGTWQLKRVVDKHKDAKIAFVPGGCALDACTSRSWYLLRPYSSRYSESWGMKLVSRADVECAADLSVAGFKVGYEGAMWLAELLTRTPSLASLDLSDNGMTSKGAAKIAGCLARLTAISSLNVSGNQLGSDGVNTVMAALARLTRLTSLNLGSNISKGAYQLRCGCTR